MRAAAFAVLTVLATGCPKRGGPPSTEQDVPVSATELPAVATDGSAAVVSLGANGQVLVVPLAGGHGRGDEMASEQAPEPRAALIPLESTGEWSGFSGAGASVTMDDAGKQLFIEVDGARVVDAEAPWWSDPMADQAGTHENGSCADESVEIMAAWIAPAQRRVLLAVEIDYPPCQQQAGYYLVGW